jgi:hypothetical protein
MDGRGRRRGALLAIAFVASLMAACGASELPTLVEGLPADVGGEAGENRPIDAGRLGAALEAEGLPRDAATGHEARWGDATRLIILEFEEIGLNEASRVSRAMLGIGEVESELVLVGNQTPFELTGPDIAGVAYQVTPGRQSSLLYMYTVVAPTEAEAAMILAAIGELHPSDE